MFNWKSIVAGGSVLTLAGGAFGSFSIAWEGIDIRALDLGEDGVWGEGEEWMFDTETGAVSLFEDWIGPSGMEVVLGSTIESTTRTPFNIGLDKMVTNNSGFGWSSFQIDLQAGAGSTISNLQAVSTSQFADVTITDNGAGSFTILWSQDGGTGVGLGDIADLMFSFDLGGTLSFTQTQIPIPTPGAAALLGLAGVVGLRRRR